MTGTVKRFNKDRGFGFIIGADGREFFFHISEVEPGTSLEGGDAIEFESADSPKGPRATNVRAAVQSPEAA